MFCKSSERARCAAPMSSLRQSAVEPLFCNFDFRSAGAMRFIPDELFVVFQLFRWVRFFHCRLGRGFRPPLADSIPMFCKSSERARCAAPMSSLRQSAVEPLFCNFDFCSAGAIRFIPGELCAVFSIPPLGSFFHRRLGRGFRPPLPDSILILRHRQTGITARHRISFGGIVRRQTFLRFWFSLGWRYAIHSRRVIRSFSTFSLGSFFSLPAWPGISANASGFDSDVL